MDKLKNRVRAVRAFNKLVSQYDPELEPLEAIMGYEAYYAYYDRFMDKLCNHVAERFGLDYTTLRFEIEHYGDNWYTYYEESKEPTL